VREEEEGMAAAGYEVLHISEIPDPDAEKRPGDPDWHAVRIHFGIRAFGANANVAREDGGALIGEHTEVDTNHEELYVVSTGHATFTLDGEALEAPAGTFVYVRDPAVTRSAVARDRGTTVLAFGGTPGEAFSVSEWERTYDAGDR
jgi:mannose-6-phosphate isomerase-like protein (cupin superfamily)